MADLRAVFWRKGRLEQGFRFFRIRPVEGCLIVLIFNRHVCAVVEEQLQAL